jgi:hypothetical protein
LLEVGLEGGDSGWLFGGEVGGLTEVFTEVVEFHFITFIPVDKLPVATADGGAWGTTLIAVVRVVPEEGAFVGFGSAKDGQEAASII